jgi:hypothetical protein
MTAPTTTGSPLSALPSDAFAQFHRTRKVMKLVWALDAAGKTAADVLAFTPAERADAERIAGVRAGSEVTWGAVVLMLNDIRPGSL